MICNFLLLNSEKTEVLIIGPETFACNNLDHCLILDGCSVNSSSSARNLYILLYSNLSFEKLAFVSSTCKTALFHLKNISKCIWKKTHCNYKLSCAFHMLSPHHPHPHPTTSSSAERNCHSITHTKTLMDNILLFLLCKTLTEAARHYVQANISIIHTNIINITIMNHMNILLLIKI